MDVSVRLFGKLCGFWKSRLPSPGGWHYCTSYCTSLASVSHWKLGIIKISTTEACAACTQCLAPSELSSYVRCMVVRVSHPPWPVPLHWRCVVYLSKTGWLGHRNWHIFKDHDFRVYKDSLIHNERKKAMKYISRAVLVVSDVFIMKCRMWMWANTYISVVCARTKFSMHSPCEVGLLISILLVRKLGSFLSKILSDSGRSKCSTNHVLFQTVLCPQHCKGLIYPPSMSASLPGGNKWKQGS